MNTTSANKASADEKKLRYAEYQRYMADPNYENVQFNPENGGLMATHKDHNFDRQTGIYEKNVQNYAFQKGHSIILESEKSNVMKKRFSDGLWDGKIFEMASSETGTMSSPK